MPIVIREIGAQVATDLGPGAAVAACAGGSWPAAIGPQYFRESTTVIDAAAGGPPDRADVKPVFVVQDPEEDALRLDGTRSELADLGVRVKNGPERSLAEPIEHVPS